MHSFNFNLKKSQQTPGVIQQRYVPGHLLYVQPKTELTWINGGLDLYV